MTSPGLEICEDSEGYAKEIPGGDCVAYWDAMGSVWTIGFGTTGPDVKKGVRWPRATAEERLTLGWRKARAGVLRASPILVRFPNRLEALTDWAYNLGVGRYQSSTLRQYVNQQRWADAAQEILKWNLAGGKVRSGLVKRRALERGLFLSQDTAIRSASPDSGTATVVPSSGQIESSATSSPVTEADSLAPVPMPTSEPQTLATRLAAFFRSLF